MNEEQELDTTDVEENYVQCIGQDCIKGLGGMTLIIDDEGIANPFCYMCFLTEVLGISPQKAYELIEEAEL